MLKNKIIQEIYKKFYFNFNKKHKINESLNKIVLRVWIFRVNILISKFRVWKLIKNVCVFNSLNSVNNAHNNGYIMYSF